MAKEVDVARALRDKKYYDSLSAEEKAQIPANPAGEIELSDADLDRASGGAVATTGSVSGTCICNSDTGTGGNPCVCPDCDAT